jgi:drug/metabolite transporter (DMT)-like permease
MTDQKKSYLYVISAVLLWSTVATSFKIALDYLTVIQMLFYSTLISMIALFVIILIQGKMKLFLSQSWKDVLKSAILGFLNPFFYYIILFRAYDLLPAQIAQPLNYTWAIVLAVLSVFILGEKLRLLSVVAIMISFIGVVILSTEGNLTSFNLVNTEGVLLAVSSSLIWATYWLVNVKDKRDPVVKLFTGFIFGSIYITLTALIRGELVLPVWEGCLSAVYIGLFEMGVTFVLWLKAISLAENSGTMGNYIFLSPFISLILIYFVLGEDIHISSIIGLVFIIGGVLLQRKSKKSPPKSENLPN